uniref:Metallothionein n=1 Tax=Iris lactea var. lactea TaxID=338655 RepID=A0A077K2X9_9ASPA|nr:metallothionein [Iris lactea var. lactea]
MSSTCGTCSCADKTNCPKKGNTYDAVIEEKTFVEEIVEFGAENDGKCKCGTTCTCVDCGCGK